MKEPTIYVYLDRVTEDAAITLDPIKYEGVENWYQVGEVQTLTELKELLSTEPFDPDCWNQFMEEMSSEILGMLTK